MKSTLLVISIVVCIGLLVWLLITFYRNSIADDKVANLSSALQNFTVAISILVAGSWTIYTFDALDQRSKAKAELAEIRQRIEDVESSNITIATKEVDYRSDTMINSKGLIIEVTITNKGNTKNIYDLSKDPLKVYEVYAKGDEMGYEKLLKPQIFYSLGAMEPNGVEEESEPLVEWISLTQSSRTLSYFVTVDTDKLYYIVFAPLDPTITLSLGDSKMDKTKSTKRNLATDEMKRCISPQECTWFVSKYVYVAGD